ncbi:MAG: pilus assembly protein N-terminal domain-containing protein [Pirellulaceae bacterium]
MHRSSKQRRQQMARSPLSKARRWKRALFAAACAASFVTGSFVSAQEIAPARKKLPTRPVTPVALTGEALAPVVRPEDLKAAAAAKSPATTSAKSPAAKLLGAPRSVFRPVAIEAIPSAETAPQVATPELFSPPQPEVKAKPIPSRLIAAVSKRPENLAPIVAASSLPRPGQKPVEEKPIEEEPAEASADPPELAAAPLSPWMQDVRASQPELQPVEKEDAPPQELAALPAPPAALPAFQAPPQLPARLTIFERAAMPVLPEAEVVDAQVIEAPMVETQVIEAPVIEAQEPAPIVPAPKARQLVQQAPEPQLIVFPSKPVRAKPLAKIEAKSPAQVAEKIEPQAPVKSEPLVIAVQNEAQPPAPAPLPGPDGDADLKKHFEVIQQTGEFSVQVHRSKLLRTAKDIYRTAVVDDAVLEIVQFTPREVSLIGRSQGATHVTFWFDDPATQPVTYLVKVEPDAGQVEIEEKKYQLLEDMINEMFPDSKIHMQLIANKLVVRGQARDSEEAFQIMALIRAQGGGYGGGPAGLGGVNGFGGINEGPAADPLADSATGAARRTNYQIINMIRVPGVQQVALRVKIAELNRTAARNFGMNLQGTIDTSDSVEGSKVLLNSILGNNGGQTAPAILANFDGDDITVGLNTLAQHGVVKLLSEPTLVTLSGNPATFIAGGEFAVPTIVGSAGLNAVTTDFRAFGAIISFLPTVVDKDRIRLQVAPEFSQINSGLTVNGTPGLKVRAATTTVEMREGQTLAIAGLLEDSINANTAGDIPFLAKLIGKRGVTRAETELIILVTPELVHPMEPEEVPPLPGFDVTEPTNSQFYWHGDIEGNPTMDYRSTVWPRLKKRYKAGGPAMTSGPFGHGQ